MQNARDEQRDGADVAEGGHQEVQHDTEHEKHHVGVAPADVVGGAGPDKSAEHVEQAHQSDEARGGDRRHAAGEHFLDHRRCLTEHADAGGHVHAQHDPQQPELRRAPGHVDRHIGRRHQLSWDARTAPSPRASNPERGTRTVNTPIIMNMK